MELIEGQPVELKGVIAEISPRFWSNGWGWCVLRLKDEEEIKVTGTLEGHSEGSYVTVRGTYKVDPKYGRKIEASVVLVESLSHDPAAIYGWLTRTFPKDKAMARGLADDLERFEDRWKALTDDATLAAIGVSEALRARIVEKATEYLVTLEHLRFLLELGFEDREAGRVVKRYGIATKDVVTADVYTLVHDGVVSFARVDTVAQHGQGMTTGGLPRLAAAVSATLAYAAQEGHTAMPESALIEEAAELAGVYPQQVAKVFDAIKARLRPHGRKWQTRWLAKAEQDIANIVWALATRENEDEEEVCSL
jgi:hypothetical protein